VLGWTGLARADDAEAAAPVAARKSPSKAPARLAAPGLPTPSRRGRWRPAAPHDHDPERPGILALPIVNDHSLQLSLFGQF
jgi:hypothetical protein